MWVDCIFSTRRIQFRVVSPGQGPDGMVICNRFLPLGLHSSFGWERCFLLLLFPWELIEVFFLSLALNLNSIEVMSVWITMYFQCPSVVFGKTSYSLGYYTGCYITDICLKSQLSSLPAAMKTEAGVFPLCWAPYSPAPIFMSHENMWPSPCSPPPYVLLSLLPFFMVLLIIHGYFMASFCLFVFSFDSSLKEKLLGGRELTCLHLH